MSRQSKVLLLFVLAIPACTRELPTNLPIGDVSYAKGGGGGWSGQYAAANIGIDASAIPVNNESTESTFKLGSIGAFSATIDMQNTHTSASTTSACMTVGDPAVASSLKPYLIDALRSRTNFSGHVSLAAVGSSSSGHKVSVFWADGPKNAKVYYYLTIGQTNPSDATFPGQFPTVTQNGSTYTYSGGIVTLRKNYNSSHNASLVCPNLDTVEITYPYVP